MLLPATCPLCHRAGPAPCRACAAAFEPAPNLPPPPGCRSCAAVLAYDGAGRELVARLKYRNARSTLGWLAGAMAALVTDDAIDAVTWVPTTVARRHARGFDQAELLARGVARRLHRPCRALLARRGGPAQTGRNGTDRLLGPAFTARPAGWSRGMPRRVLLVDDVVTTGATLSAAARALIVADVDEVAAIAAARTPLKRVQRRPDIQR